MTRMIERWFPCAEVSEASRSGWGSGRSEKALFTWFAARPLAQAKAAVLTSLLLWPEDHETQKRLQELVRRAMAARDGAWSEIVGEIRKAHPEGASLLDPFSGRAMIPLEAARVCVQAEGIDYSPVATLAGQLLADYPLRDWSSEPPLPISARSTDLDMGHRLVNDVAAVLDEIGRRYEQVMAPFYPQVQGKQPWGYLWAVSLPCQECGRHFPLTGSLVLRHPLSTKGDPGQSYRIEVDQGRGTFHVVVESGPPTGRPTVVPTTHAGKAVRGRSAVCPFCGHLHPKALHQRLASERFGRDNLLLVADLDEDFGKVFREPVQEELDAAQTAANQLAHEPSFPSGLPLVPNEVIPAGNVDTVRPSAYGAKTYGDMCVPRQTLGLGRLSGIIADLGKELARTLSPEYASTLSAYAASVLVRVLKYSTRGAHLRPYAPTGSRQQNWIQVDHIFTNEASIAFSYDFFEAGIGSGPGTWPSLTADTVNVLRNQQGRPGGVPARITRGSATSLPLQAASVSAVVTDPPYDSMIDYSDASDLFYVWLKRALGDSHPWLLFTSDPHGVQEKDQEVIVKRGGSSVNDHRDDHFYDRMIAEAFAEACRVVTTEGVVTIVFGHGDPDVWHRLLAAITTAGLVLTGSWPAKTEAGGGAGSANIVTTLTMACRPAPISRKPGRTNLVDAEVRREVKARIPMWDAAGLAPTDQLMASAGPAMEVVGRYSEVLDPAGNAVESDRYLLVARRAVEEAASVQIDDLPLETFDARTRFALSWVRLYGRAMAPKSEARWQALASDLEANSLKGVLTDADKGARFSYAKDWTAPIDDRSAVIDVALAMAKAWPDGLDEVGQQLAASQRTTDDPYLWAAMNFLSSRLPEGDPDAIAWTGIVRNRRGVGSLTRQVLAERDRQDTQRRARDAQGVFFETLDARGVEETARE